ncbi:MAG: hypothetical protein ACI4Q6_03380, partial [Huintestinicola sp.]
MMTNGVCTTFRYSENSLERIGTFPCMWQETEAYEAKKYGISNADKAAVWIPHINTNIVKGDYIFFGE